MQKKQQTLLPKKSNRNSLRKKYSITKIKSRYFLTNISYNRLKVKDHDYVSFLINVYSFILLNFNPSNLERKFIEKDNKEYIKMLWARFIPKELLDFVSQGRNFKKLNTLLFKYVDANEIINQFIQNDPKKFFCRTDEYGLKYKSESELAFKDWKSNQKKFDVSVPKVGPVQGQVQFITKTDKINERKMKKILKREEKKHALMEDLRVNDTKMARIKYNK